MSRFLLLALAITVGVGTTARGQGADEVKRLNERIELLEAKLEIAMRDNQLLKERIAELESGETKTAKVGPFAVGSRWVGTVEITAPKARAQSVKATIEVTKLEDGKFEATYEALDLLAVITGTVRGDRIKWNFDHVLKTPEGWKGKNFAANLEIKSGTIRGDRITGLFNWPEIKAPAFEQPASSGKFVFELSK